MKQIILSIVISLTAIVATAQTGVRRQPANLPTGQAGYEAANWKTWLLDNPQQITIAAPPAAAQSKAELQSIKQGIGKLDEKKLSGNKILGCRSPCLPLESNYTWIGRPEARNTTSHACIMDEYCYL